jgi:hypothetical protein
MRTNGVVEILSLGLGLNFWFTNASLPDDTAIQQALISQTISWMYY